MSEDSGDVGYRVVNSFSEDEELIRPANNYGYRFDVITGLDGYKEIKKALDKSFEEPVTKEKPEHVFKEYIDNPERQKRISELFKLIGSYKGTVGRSVSGLALIGEYVKLKMEFEADVNPILKGNRYINVEVKQMPEECNYLTCSIMINYFNSEESAKLGLSSTGKYSYIQLRELFSNCSSIVVNKYDDRVINDIYRYTYTQGKDAEIPEDMIVKYKARYVKQLFSTVEEICYSIGYSNMLYTFSKQESNSKLGEYLSQNWQLTDSFVNKRTKHNIEYYSKKL